MNSFFSPKLSLLYLSFVFLSLLSFSFVIVNLYTGTAYASTFPRDAINVRNDFSANASATLTSALPSDSTILYESFNTASKTAGASLRIFCGDTTLLQVNDFANVDALERFKEALCLSGTPISVRILGTTGSPTTTISLIYVPRDRATTFDPQEATDTLLTAQIQRDQDFSVGLLIAIATLALFDFVRRIFAGKAGKPFKL